MRQSSWQAILSATTTWPFLGGHKEGNIANAVRQLKKLLARALLDRVEQLVNDHNLALSWRPQEEQHSHSSKMSAEAAVMA